MDLTTATPVEIDTALAEIYSRYYAVQGKVAQTLKYIKDMQQGLKRKAEGDRSYSYWKEADLLTLEAQYEVLQEEAQVILAETLPYESEFRRRPWSRFFWVKNNGGHIHSSMNCSTCFVTTQFGWLPEESGKDEATAVAKHGAILCTVCYPTAPVEWTNGKKPGDEDVCEGSGRYFDSSLPHRTGYYSGNWAECPECHTNQTVTKAFKIRKHKVAA